MAAGRTTCQELAAEAVEVAAEARSGGPSAAVASALRRSAFSTTAGLRSTPAKRTRFSRGSGRLRRTPAPRNASTRRRWRRALGPTHSTERIRSAGRRAGSSRPQTRTGGSRGRSAQAFSRAAFLLSLFSRADEEGRIQSWQLILATVLSPAWAEDVAA